MQKVNTTAQQVGNGRRGIFNVPQNTFQISRQSGQ